MSWYESDYGRSASSPPSVTPAVKALLIATIAVFVAELAIGRTMIDVFGLVPALALRRLCLWQFVTYIFLHDPTGISHVAFNMIALYFFGPVVERLLGSRRFVWFYIGAGAFAGLAHSAIGVFSAPDRPVIGASGAIFAVLVVCAMYSPNMMVILFFIIPMKIKHLVILFIGINVYLTLQTGPHGRYAALAHLGGAAFGYLYYRFAVDGGRRTGRSIGSRIGGWLSGVKGGAERRRKQRESAEDGRVEELLEKISREGMNSLSESEKQFLVDAARRRRERDW